MQADRVLSADQAERLHDIYLESFGILRTTAAARHVLSHAEFLDEMIDPRIVKYSVWRSASEPIALATVTNDLDAVTWVSPEFFAARHPQQAARKAIYYLGIALVAPQRGQFRLLERMVRELVAACVADRGVLAYDVCAFNDVTVRFGRRAEAILQRIAPVRVGVADTQTYYEALFD
ncbi:MAG TPA: hypothetical protein VIT42_04305 [Microlunatus sp.]